MKEREEGLRLKYSRGRQLRIKDKNCTRRKVEAEPQQNLLAIWAIPGWNGLPGDRAEPHCSCRQKLSKNLQGLGAGLQGCPPSLHLECGELIQQGSQGRHSAAWAPTRLQLLLLSFPAVITHNWESNFPLQRL